MRLQLQQLAADAPGHVRRHVGRRQQNVEQNVKDKGVRMLMHQICGTLTSVSLACMCLLGVTLSKDACVTSPMSLKEWYYGMLAYQGISCLIFLIMHYGYVSVMSKHVALRDVQADRLPHPPLPHESPLLTWASGAVLVVGLTWILLMWVVIGLFVAIDATFNNAPDQCGAGRHFIWYCVFFVLFQMRCCHVWSVNDAHDAPGQRESETDAGRDVDETQIEGMEAGVVDVSSPPRAENNQMEILSP